MARGWFGNGGSCHGRTIASHHLTYFPLAEPATTNNPASLASSNSHKNQTHIKLNDAYPSKYLTAEDLGDAPVTATIEEVDLEEIGQGADKSKKLVIGFTGKKKKFVVNKTNANTIAKVLGSDDTDDWIGQRITLRAMEVEFQGNMVMSIRVSLKKPTSGQAAEAKAAVSDNDGGDGLPEGF